LCICL